MNVVFNVVNREFKDSLEHLGFEVLSIVGDNISSPKSYTMRGNPKRLEDRHKVGIQLSKWVNKKFSSMYKIGKDATFAKGNFAIGGRYE